MPRYLQARFGLPEESAVVLSEQAAEPAAATSAETGLTSAGEQAPQIESQGLAVEQATQASTAAGADASEQSQDGQAEIQESPQEAAEEEGGIAPEASGEEEAAAAEAPAAEAAIAELAESEAAEDQETAEGVVASQGAFSAPAETAPADSFAHSFESTAQGLSLVPRPRMSIAMPQVASPPPEIAARREDIRKRTGGTPERHHADVRQAVVQVVEGARSAQRQMIYRIQEMAGNTYLTIEQLADQIPGVVADAVAYIHQVVRAAEAPIRSYAQHQIDAIGRQGVLEGNDLTQRREQVAQQVLQNLVDNSETLPSAQNAIQNSFDANLETAQDIIIDIPRDGVGRPLPIPHPQAEQRPARREPKEDPMPSQRLQEPRTDGSDVKNLALAQQNLSGEIQALEEGNRLGAFQAFFCRPALKHASNDLQNDLIEGAANRAIQLGSGTTRAQFALSSLGLVAPVTAAQRTDADESAETVRCGTDEQNQRTQTATERVQQMIAERCDGVIRHMNKRLAPDLAGSVRKIGYQVQKDLRQQAAATEHALLNSSASMADSYPDLVDRVGQMVPPGRFLDSRDLLPRLRDAARSVQQMQKRQIAAAASQAQKSVKQVQEGQSRQIDAIDEAAQKSRQSVEDTKVVARFDFEFTAVQYTVNLAEVSNEALTPARRFAERTARGLIGTNAAVNVQLQRLENSAVRMFNNAIENEVTAYVRAVRHFEDQFKKMPDGTMDRISREILKRVSRLAGRVHHALPRLPVDEDVAIGALGAGGVLAPHLAGFASLTQLITMYIADADEDEVVEAIGDLPWPGQPAIEEVFNSEYPGPLRSRIRQSMEPHDRQRVLNLLDEQAAVRGRARLDIAQASAESTWFGYSSGAREAVLRGLSSEERTAVGQQAMESAGQTLHQELSGTERDISEAYLSDDRARVLEARIRETVQRARCGSYAEMDQRLVVAVEDIANLAREELAVEYASAGVPPDEIRALTNQAFQVFAARSDRRYREADADAIPVEEAQQAFFESVTGMSYEYSGSAMVSGEHAQNYIRALITQASTSREIRVARALYDLSRAEEGDDMPSQTEQMRVIQPFEDQHLAHLQREYDEHPERREELEPQLTAARRQHEEFMQAVAHELDPGVPEEDATAYVANRVSRLFARGDEEHARYGRELIEEGRASLVAGVRLATKGAGTHEELLRHATANRSRREIDEARNEYRRIAQNEYFGLAEQDLDVMLGFGQREYGTREMAVSAIPVVGSIIGLCLYGAEVSGDLAFELEENFRGEPETDLDHIEITALHYDQQRIRGTGELAGLTMAGTPEAQTLDRRRRELGLLILSAARQSGNQKAAEIVDPATVFTPGGRIRQEVTKGAFDENNRFLGDRNRLYGLISGVDVAADNYRAEIDRQESILTGAITALAIAVSVIALLVPGVNVVAAGVLTALITGGLTMAAKLTMRGGRYGWEEAATDAAMAGVEAATAGVGGALAGGLGRAGMAGRLAGINKALADRIGRVGTGMVREGFTGAASSSAQVALQDETWQDGLDRGLERIFKGGVRGVAVGAVTAGVSEGISVGLERSIVRSLSRNLSDPADLRRLQRLAVALGPRGSDILKEAVSESLGSFTGEGAGIFFDVLSGRHRGGLKEALKQMGEAGLRDMVSGAGRSAVLGRNRARYRRLLTEARSRTNVNDADLRVLRRAAISAGEMQYSDSLDTIRSRVSVGRKLVDSLPPSLQVHARGLDVEQLEQIRDMLDTGYFGTAADRGDFIAKLQDKVPDLDARALMCEIKTAESALRQAEESAPLERQERRRIRSLLVSGLDKPLRRAMADVPLEGLQRLPEADLQRAADMVAQRRFDNETVADLMRIAKAANADLNEIVFWRNLYKAVETARQAYDIETQLRAKQREDVLNNVPQEARHLFARLPDGDIATVKKLLDQERSGSPQQREALFRKARQEEPELQRNRFMEFLDAAISRAKAVRDAQRRERRRVREKRLNDLPAALRGLLSALPDHALVELRIAQGEGQPLSPALRHRLLDAARRETPNTDLEVLSKALDEAAALGRPELTVSGRQAAALRVELAASVPRDQRRHLDEVPILVMRDDAFEGITRSHKGQAVTLIIHGRPVVVMRESADPAVLREEGLHVLQYKDPAWSRRIGMLEETKLADWDRLPLEEQIALYRNKVEVEIDAQQRLLANLEPQHRRTEDPDQAADLSRQIERAKTSLDNLKRRHTEVAGITALKKLAMEAGMADRPEWLDQPARLFAKSEEPSISSTLRKVRRLLIQVPTDQESEEVKIDHPANVLKEGFEPATIRVMEQLPSLLQLQSHEMMQRPSFTRALDLSEEVKIDHLANVLKEAFEPATIRALEQLPSLLQSHEMMQRPSFTRALDLSIERTIKDAFDSSMSTENFLNQMRTMQEKVLTEDESRTKDEKRRYLEERLKNALDFASMEAARRIVSAEFDKLQELDFDTADLSNIDILIETQINDVSYQFPESRDAQQFLRDGLELVRKFLNLNVWIVKNRGKVIGGVESGKTRNQLLDMYLKPWKPTIKKRMEYEQIKEDNKDLLEYGTTRRRTFDEGKRAVINIPTSTDPSQTTAYGPREEELARALAEQFDLKVQSAGTNRLKDQFGNIYTFMLPDRLWHVELIYDEVQRGGLWRSENLIKKLVQEIGRPLTDYMNSYPPIPRVGRHLDVKNIVNRSFLFMDENFDLVLRNDIPDSLLTRVMENRRSFVRSENQTDTFGNSYTYLSDGLWRVDLTYEGWLYLATLPGQRTGHPLTEYFLLRPTSAERPSFIERTFRTFVIINESSFFVHPSRLPPAVLEKISQQHGTSGEAHAILGTGRGDDPTTAAFSTQTPRVQTPSGRQNYFRQSHEEQLRRLALGTAPERPGTIEVRDITPLEPGSPANLYAHDQLADAYRFYQEALVRAMGREVAIFRNIDTGEYAVCIGTVALVKHPEVGNWEGVLHYHPIPPENALSLRNPSTGDIKFNRKRAQNVKHAITEYIEYPLPGGLRGRTMYRVTPGGRITVEYTQPDGRVIRKQFDNLKEYEADYSEHKIYLSPEDPLYKALQQPGPSGQGQMIVGEGGHPLRLAGPITDRRLALAETVEKYVHILRTEMHLAGSIGRRWDWTRFPPPLPPGMKWEPGLSIDMPTKGGCYPNYNRQGRGRYWKNRAYFEMKARERGEVVRDLSVRDLDPMRAASDGTLKWYLESPIDQVISPRTSVGRPWEIEHHRIQQQWQKAFIDAGFLESDANRLAGTVDPFSLREVTPLHHGFEDAFANRGGNRADIEGNRWRETQEADPRQRRPLEGMSDVDIIEVVRMVRQSPAEYDFFNTDRARELREALLQEINLRGLNVMLGWDIP